MSIVALCGGVGGAKLADGLANLLGAQLTLIVNTGDDFEHVSLAISPDLDTVLYTLAGLAHPTQGWGRADESWQVFDELKRLGGPDWFMLGDKDIALHLLRRQLMQDGATLGEAMAEMGRRLGIAAHIVPATNDPLRTIVETDEGTLAFQTYFVRRRCAPAVRQVRFEGAETARPNPHALAALHAPDLRGVILCPSNPYLSIAPILAVPGLRDALRALRVPVIAISPIIGGQAIKGPAAKMMRELGLSPSPATIAAAYADFCHAILLDEADRALHSTDSRFHVAKTLMQTREDRIALAQACLDLLETLARRKQEC